MTKLLAIVVTFLLITNAASSPIFSNCQNETTIHGLPFSTSTTGNDTSSIPKGWNIETWIKKVGEQPVTNGPFCLTPWSDKTCAFSTRMDVTQSNIEMWYYDHNCKELGRSHIVLLVYHT